MPLGGEDLRGEDLRDEDPQAPLFFLSYAHAGKGQQQDLLVNFFDDLSYNIAQLVPRPDGADPGYMPGYIDRSMIGGNPWVGELLQAIGTCRVFVALLSAAYFKSTWCGKEWFAFAQRPIVRNADSGREQQSGIIPVVWAPLPPGRTPAAVAGVQRFSPGGIPNVDIAHMYQTEGVFGLRRTQGDLYDAVVWKLARRIADVYYNYHVEPRVLQEDELKDIFGEQAT